MTDTQTPAVEDKPKRRGPKSRAEIEAELREQIEAETREKVEAELRAEFEQQATDEARIREEAAALGPASVNEIDGDPQQEGAVTIHFVEDGLTILGKIWFRGETLTINPDTQNWKDAIVNVTKGSNEKIMFALMDEDQQIAKWGRRFFRPGPWRGTRLDEINEEDLTPAEKAQLEKQQKIHDARYGG